MSGQHPASPTDRPAVAAIGKFDALHLGHRALASAAAGLGRPLLLGFAGMPAALGWPARAPVVDPADRGRVLAAWSAELGSPLGWLELDFAGLRQLEAPAFVRFLRDRLGLGGVVVGEDFRFGRQRSGGIADLHAWGARLGLQVTVLPHLRVDGEPVSSSTIRDRLDAGSVAGAARLLGRPHRLLGRVIAGDRRGRTLGYPTANCGGIAGLLPADGVYAARVGLEGGAVTLPAAVNIGLLPTIAGQRERRVEAHLLDWSGDCYGQAVSVDFIDRLRPERSFPSLEALRQQIASDVDEARRLLRGAGPGPDAGLGSAHVPD